MNECKSRNDVSNLLTFRSFCNIGDCDFDCLNEWKRINVEVKDMVVSDFAWDPYQSLLITLHKPKSKAKKSIYCLIKLLIFSNSCCPNKLIKGRFEYIN